ncbi:MAG TPA: BolA family transcriptional regulator [Lentisphaeria bacterium]|nr:BolA family transcriptional regulator [Lentisphaeria bacterium]
MDRVATIRERLIAAFAPVSLEIEDESHLHIGHPGARSGGGHFSVTITAEALNGMSRVTQHRKIYAALGEMMGTEIHALRIQAGEA